MFQRGPKILKHCVNRKFRGPWHLWFTLYFKGPIGSLVRHDWLARLRLGQDLLARLRMGQDLLARLRMGHDLLARLRMGHDWRAWLKMGHDLLARLRMGHDWRAWLEMGHDLLFLFWEWGMTKWYKAKEGYSPNFEVILKLFWSFVQRFESRLFFWHWFTMYNRSWQIHEELSIRVFYGRDWVR